VYVLPLEKHGKNLGDDALETTLLVIRECFVYKIPTRGPLGFKAADWDLPNPLWTGRLAVKSKGPQAYVKLEDSNSGEVFAVCPVTEASIEPVNDSSRYYVLKIEDGQKRHAFIGLGFSERSEAFDFSAALQDHARFVKQEKEAENNVAKLAAQPSVDYSLKQGEKITINMTNAPKPRSRPAGDNSSGGFSGLLPPPPGSKVTHRPVAPAAQSHAQQNDIFSTIQAPNPSQGHNQAYPQQQQQGFAQQQNNDPFASFSSQGGFQQQQQQAFPQQGFAQQQSNDPFASLTGFSSPPQQQRPVVQQQQQNNPFNFF